MWIGFIETMRCMLMRPNVFVSLHECLSRPWRMLWYFCQLTPLRIYLRKFSTEEDSKCDDIRPTSFLVNFVITPYLWSFFWCIDIQIFSFCRATGATEYPYLKIENVQPKEGKNYLGELFFPMTPSADLWEILLCCSGTRALCLHRN